MQIVYLWLHKCSSALEAGRPDARGSDGDLISRGLVHELITFPVFAIAVKQVRRACLALANGRDNKLSKPPLDLSFRDEALEASHLHFYPFSMSNSLRPRSL